MVSIAEKCEEELAALEGKRSKEVDDERDPWLTRMFNELFWVSEGKLGGAYTVTEDALGAFARLAGIDRFSGADVAWLRWMDEAWVEWRSEVERESFTTCNAFVSLAFGPSIDIELVLDGKWLLDIVFCWSRKSKLSIVEVAIANNFLFGSGALANAFEE